MLKTLHYLVSIQISSYKLGLQMSRSSMEDSCSRCLYWALGNVLWILLPTLCDQVRPIPHILPPCWVMPKLNILTLILVDLFLWNKKLSCSLFRIEVRTKLKKYHYIVVHILVSLWMWGNMLRIFLSHLLGLDLG